jgi:hypothetical protein
MTPDPPPPRFRRRVGRWFLAALLVWLACGFWNFVKPMPPGTHVSSLPARLGESQVDFIEDAAPRGSLLPRELGFIDRAEQMIVLDQCPLAPQLAEHLLARKRQRPNLKIVLVTDPRGELYGGTPATTLSALEAAGIIVARIKLERLRDSNPLYSSFWRLAFGWWSDPFDDPPGQRTLTSSLRALNDKSDQRQLLVADDGAGGWSSILASAAPRDGGATGNVGLEVRGRMAHDIVASELQIAAWSSDDDRLPGAPPVENRGVGTIDARVLTEGAIHAALRDAIAGAGGGDSVSVMARALGDRQLVHALLRATAQGAHLQLLLDPRLPANQAVAAELLRTAAGSIDIRWQARGAGTHACFVLIQHRNDVWLNLGSAEFTRRALDDLNLETNIELHMPARAAPARAAAESFARAFSSGAAYADHADERPSLYWRYRLAEATGLRVP